MYEVIFKCTIKGKCFARPFTFVGSRGSQTIECRQLSLISRKGPCALEATFANAGRGKAPGFLTTGWTELMTGKRWDDDWVRMGLIGVSEMKIKNRLLRTGNYTEKGLSQRRHCYCIVRNAINRKGSNPSHNHQ